MVRVAALLAAAAVVSTAPAAHAEPEASITLSPFYLAVTTLAATAEFEPTPHLGLALDAGAGHLPMAASAWLYDLGAHANVYLTRPFSGWHLGTEVFALWGSMSTDIVPLVDSTMATGSVTEKIIGVYGGYKWLTRSGFTAVLQYGVGRMDVTSSSDAPSSKIVPIANFTIGWSI